MTNGAGFIALAALIFGRWRPWSAFARRDAVRLHARTRHPLADPRRDRSASFAIPSEFWQSLPYVVTIVVVAGAVGRADPAGRGRPTVRAVAMSDSTRVDWDALRRAARGDRAARVRAVLAACRSARPRSSTTAASSPAATSRTRRTASRLCAECGLVSALHASGGGRLVAFACVDGATGAPLAPCGRCRQLLWEAGGARAAGRHRRGPGLDGVAAPRRVRPRRPARRGRVACHARHRHHPRQARR